MKNTSGQLLTGILATMLCVAWSSAALAEPPEQVAADTRAWLQRMAEAIRTLDYQGVLVYGSLGNMRTMHLVHRYRNGREQERLQTLSGEPVEILRDDDVVTCIHPRDHRVTVDRRELHGMIKEFAHLAEPAARRSYRIVREPDARVLQRSCHVYSFLPRDQFRYGYRVFADQQTALPLRIDTINSRQQVIEQVMFTQISFPSSISDAALTPKVDASQYEWAKLHAADGVHLHGQSQWVAQRLPQGFQLVGFRATQPASSNRPVEHLLYSDGLATVSVFVTPHSQQGRYFEGVSSLGPVHAFGRKYEGYQISVLGDVPAVTVRLIGDHLDLREK